MGKHADSIDRTIVERIRHGPVGAVVCPGDFLDLGNRAAIDQALSRSVREGVLRRVARGLYDIPQTNARFGPGPPPIEEFLKAVSRRDGVRIRRSGGHAAHALGLTDQVPMREIYLTDGRSRALVVGTMPIRLKHASHRSVAVPGDASYDVIQGLRWIGRENVDRHMVAHLSKILSCDHKAQLRRDLGFAPGWLLPWIRQIAASSREGAISRNGLLPTARTSAVANPRGGRRMQRRGRGGGE